MPRRTDPFKGLYRCRRINAAGKLVVYCYAWRGGPLLKDPHGVPLKEGTPEFARAFLEAKTGFVAPEHGGKPQSVFDLIRAYKAATEFTRLSDKTRKNYARSIKLIENKFGTMPLAALRAPSIRAVFKKWRDGFAQTPRTADYHLMVLTRIFSVAKDNGSISDNPCSGIGDIYDPNRTEAVWSDADLAKLAAVASPEVWAVVQMALWTGQRQGTILTMPWGAYDGTHLRFQSNKRKRGQRAVALQVKVAAELKAVLDALPKRSTLIHTNSRGMPWTSDGFRTSFDKAKTTAGITGLTFHDLRGTAVTRLAKAGCTVPEIASLTGHSLADVSAMLDRHYLGGRAALAEAAVAKYEQMGIKNCEKLV